MSELFEAICVACLLSIAYGLWCLNHAPADPYEDKDDSSTIIRSKFDEDEDN